MSDNYIPGEVTRISVSVIGEAGVAADPGGLRLKIKPPTGAVATFAFGVGTEIVKDAVGRYHADIQLTAAGMWAWRWELDAPNTGAVEGVITVLKSRVI